MCHCRDGDFVAIAATHPDKLWDFGTMYSTITANSINLHGNVIALSIVIGVAQLVA